MQREILDQLQTNPTLNLPVIGFFENYPLEKHIVYNKSLILCGTSDYNWAYLSVPESNDLIPLLEIFDFESLYFANVEEWMIPQLTQTHSIEWKLLTNRYFLPDDANVDLDDRVNGQLDQSHVGYIYQNSAYKDFTNESYISERITKDISAGIWINDTLIGWGLTHDDGSLGFLNVLSEYRGKGIGESIFRSLVHAKRQANKPVFVNVEPPNKQSIGLLQKLGFTYDRSVSWVKLA